MTIIARSIASTPARTASETWDVIVRLISAVDSQTRKEMNQISGFAASIIADELPKESPIVVAGSGPRLRIYCVYGEDAITGEDCDEGSLAWNPTESGWRMYLPSVNEDLGWISDALRARSERVLAYDANEGVPEEAPEVERSERTSKFSIDLGGFLRK